MDSLTSNKPYLIRAIYDWIVDNRLTPYLMVDAEFPHVQVPMAYVNEGRIVLNVSPEACRGLHMENDRIVFSARFANETFQIHVVPEAVMAIYAKENGRGMEFPVDEQAKMKAKEALQVEQAQRSAPNARKTKLTLVKKED